MLFSYILTGWEGSATDSRVWADALAKGFSAPEGFYYLADSGYPHCKDLLIPFSGVRYHLQEWGAANVRYVFLFYFILFYCYNNFIARQMQRNCSTSVMLKRAMSSSVLLEFSRTASEFSFSLLIIHSTFRLAFRLPCPLSKISFKYMTTTKVQYPPIHTKHLMHLFLLILMMTVVSLKMMKRTIPRLNYGGKI
jgi:hypothetical protein